MAIPKTYNTSTSKGRQFATNAPLEGLTFVYKVSRLSCVVDFGNGCTDAQIVCMYIYIATYKHNLFIQIPGHVRYSARDQSNLSVILLSMIANYKYLAKIDKLNGTWAGGGFFSLHRN